MGRVALQVEVSFQTADKHLPRFGGQARTGNRNGSLEHSKHLIRPQLGLPDRGSVENKASRKEKGHRNLIKRGGGIMCSRNKLISHHCLPCGPARSNPHDIQ